MGHPHHPDYGSTKTALGVAAINPAVRPGGKPFKADAQLLSN
jgi:hypothetical protein